MKKLTKQHRAKLVDLAKTNIEVNNSNTINYTLLAKQQELIKEALTESWYQDYNFLFKITYLLDKKYAYSNVDKKQMYSVCYPDIWYPIPICDGITSTKGKPVEVKTKESHWFNVFITVFTLIITSTVICGIYTNIFI